MKLEKHSTWDKKTNNPLVRHYEEKWKEVVEEYGEIFEAIVMFYSDKLAGWDWPHDQTSLLPIMISVNCQKK